MITGWRKSILASWPRSRGTIVDHLSVSSCRSKKREVPNSRKRGSTHSTRRAFAFIVTMDFTPRSFYWTPRCLSPRRTCLHHSSIASSRSPSGTDNPNTVSEAVGIIERLIKTSAQIDENFISRITKVRVTKNFRGGKSGARNSPNQLSSNPELSNFRVRQFSVTVRTTLSGAPEGISASISMVMFTLASSKPARCATTELAIVSTSRDSRAASILADPWKRRMTTGGGATGRFAG